MTSQNFIKKKQTKESKFFSCETISVFFTKRFDFFIILVDNNFLRDERNERKRLRYSTVSFCPVSTCYVLTDLLW